MTACCHARYRSLVLGPPWLGCRLLLPLALWCLVSVAHGQLLQRSLVFEGAQFQTADGKALATGSMVVTGERIRDLGPSVKAPPLAKKLDLSGTVITPGLIDVLGTVSEASDAGRADTGARGGSGRGGARPGSGRPGNASSASSGSRGALQRTEDGFDHYAVWHMQELLRQGITSLYLTPAGPGGICGSGAVVRLTHNADDSWGTLLQSEASVCIDLGSDDPPLARLKTLQSVQRALQQAQDYRRNQEAYEEELTEYMEQLGQQAKSEAGEAEKPEPKSAAEEPKKEPEAKPAADKPGESSGPKKPRRPQRDRSAELLLKALDGEIPVRILAHRSSDILNALELAEEFSLRLVIEGAAEAHLVADQIAAAEASIVLGRMDLPAQRQNDPLRRRLDQPGAVFDRTGITWCVGSGAETPELARFVLPNALLASAYAGGPDALRLVTVRAAAMLRTPQIGVLARGAMADFVVWSADPRDPAARVLQVYVGGKEVYKAQ